MTTLLNLAGTPMLVPFDSSLRLQNAVDTHRSNAWRGHLRANSGLDGTRLPTHPIELLLHIGQATAFLPPPMQPITWLWPLARYLPALELTPQRRLRLKTAAHRQVAGHQLGVLSEAFGTAAGCLLAARHLWPNNAVQVNDLDWPPPKTNWKSAPGQSTQPDLWLRPPGKVGAVVETKGAATRAPVGALARGARQLNGSLVQTNRTLDPQRWICAGHGIKTDNGFGASALRVHRLTSPATTKTRVSRTGDVERRLERALAGFLPSAAPWDVDDGSDWVFRPQTLGEVRWDERTFGNIRARGRALPIDDEHELFVGVTGEAYDWLTSDDRRPRSSRPQRSTGSLRSQDQELDQSFTSELPTAWDTTIEWRDAEQVVAISSDDQVIAIRLR